MWHFSDCGFEMVQSSERCEIYVGLAYLLIYYYLLILIVYYHDTHVHIYIYIIHLFMYALFFLSMYIILEK